MTQPILTVNRMRAWRTQLDGALITPSLETARVAGLQGADGAPWYLPVYAGVTRGGAGAEAFESALAPDGTLTLFLVAAPPTNVVGTPNFAGTEFGLVLDASGGSTALPLEASPQGGSLWCLRKTLSGPELARIRDALFDTIPNVAVQVTQKVQLAVLQTESFVRQAWDNDVIKSGIIREFGGIPYGTVESLLNSIKEEPEFERQYMVLDVTFRWTVPVPPLPGYVRWQVDWNGRAYNYYQDNIDRARVFFLPDGFVLNEKRDGDGKGEGDAVSLLRFSPPEEGGAVEATETTFRFHGRPDVTWERIEAAKQALRDKLGLEPSMVSIQDAHGVTARFILDLPNARATASEPVTQGDASIDFGKGLRNEVRLNFAQFRALWAAIFSTAPENPLFLGRVEVSLLDGKYTERLDFTGRLSGNKEAGFLDAILDEGTNRTYATELTLKTRKEVFAGPPQIVEIAVIFQDRTVTFEADEPRFEKKISIAQSLRDIVLGRQPSDSYPYILRVTRADGSSLCCARTAPSVPPTLWLLATQIAECKDPCA